MTPAPNKHLYWATFWSSLWVVGLGLHMLGVIGDADSHRFVAWWAIILGGILALAGAAGLLACYGGKERDET